MSQDQTVGLLLQYLSQNSSQDHLSPYLSNMLVNITRPQHSSGVWVCTAACLALLAALGTVGNSLVVLTTVCIPQMHRLTYTLVASLSATGLLVSAVSIPLHVVHLVVRSTDMAVWLDVSGVSCKVQAFFNLSLMLTLLAETAMIAVCRYRSILQARSVRFHSESKKTWQILLFLWIVPLLLSTSAGPFLGFNNLVLDCYLVDTHESLWYMTVAITLPAIATTVCVFTSYALILKRVRDSRLKIMNFQILHHKNSRPASSTSDMKIHSESDKDELFQISSQAKQAIQVSVLRTADSRDASNTLCVPSTSAASPPGVMQLAANSSVMLPEINSINLAPLGNIYSNLASGEITLVNVVPVKMPHFHHTTPEMISSSLSIPQPSLTAGKLEPASSTLVAKNKAGNKQFKREVRLTFHLYLAFVTFCLLYLPACFVHLLHAVRPQSADTWLVVHTLSMSFSSSTWIFYGFLNRDFRKACRALLTCKRNF